MRRSLITARLIFLRRNRHPCRQARSGDECRQKNRASRLLRVESAQVVFGPATRRFAALALTVADGSLIVAATYLLER